MSRFPAEPPYPRWLHVEDNPGDARLVRILLTELYPEVQLTHVSTGREALQFVQREGAYAEAETPDLILLDVTLQDMDGAEVLRAIRTFTHCRQVPTVMLA